MQDPYGPPSEPFMRRATVNSNYGGFNESEARRLDASPMRASGGYVPHISQYNNTALKSEFAAPIRHEPLPPPLRPVGAPHTGEMLAQIETL